MHLPRQGGGAEGPQVAEVATVLPAVVQVDLVRVVAAQAVATSTQMPAKAVLAAVAAAHQSLVATAVTAATAAAEVAGPPSVAQAVLQSSASTTEDGHP